MNLTDIRRIIANIKTGLTQDPQVSAEALKAVLEATSNLTRVIETAMTHRYLDNRQDDRILLRDTKSALSLAEKLTKSQPGEFVHLTAEELKHAEKIIRV